jgi:hypothetical protein
VIYGETSPWSLPTVGFQNEENRLKCGHFTDLSYSAFVVQGRLVTVKRPNSINCKPLLGLVKFLEKVRRVKPI